MPTYNFHFCKDDVLSLISVLSCDMQCCTGKVDLICFQWIRYTSCDICLLFSFRQELWSVTYLLCMYSWKFLYGIYFFTMALRGTFQVFVLKIMQLSKFYFYSDTMLFFAAVWGSLHFMKIWCLLVFIMVRCQCVTVFWLNRVDILSTAVLFWCI